MFNCNDSADTLYVHFYSAKSVDGKIVDKYGEIEQELNGREK